jgi:hypothetical protein
MDCRAGATGGQRSLLHLPGITRNGEGFCTVSLHGDDQRDELPSVADYIAGMTDRFAGREHEQRPVASG